MNPKFIEELIQLITLGGSTAVDLYLKLEPLVHLGPDEKANIAKAIVASDSADEDSKKTVREWMALRGYSTNV